AFVCDDIDPWRRWQCIASDTNDVVTIGIQAAETVVEQQRRSCCDIVRRSCGDARRRCGRSRSRERVNGTANGGPIGRLRASPAVEDGCGLTFVRPPGCSERELLDTGRARLHDQMIEICERSTVARQNEPG